MARAKKKSRGSGAVPKDKPPAEPEPTEEASPAAAPSAGEPGEAPAASPTAETPGAPPAPPEPPAKPTEEAAPAAATLAPYVAVGKSVTSKRGILGPGKRVHAADFGKGQKGEDNLRALLASGAVVER